MIPVRIISDDARVSPEVRPELFLELRLVSGVEVRVPRGFSAEDLRRLLEVLR